MHRDKLGKIIEIGDIAISNSQYYKEAEPVVIVGFTPHRVKINEGTVVEASCLIVISAQLYSNNFDPWTHTLHAKYSEQIAQGHERLKQLQNQ